MEQHHIIKRQVLDIGLESDVGSFLFQGELRDIYYAEIVPLLEQCCSDMDDSSEVYKINKLEIDLGTLDQNNLVEDFKSKVLKQFYDGLSKAIRDMPSKEEIDLRDKLAAESGAYPGATEEDAAVHYKAGADESELELLSHFLKTGRLPWWSRKEERPDFDTLVDKLLLTDAEFVKLVEDLIAIPVVLTRIIYQFSDKQLEKTAEIFSKLKRVALGNQIKEMLDRINKSTVLKHIPEHTIRNEIWQAVFKVLKADPLRDFDGEKFDDQLVNQLPVQYRQELILEKNGDQHPEDFKQTEGIKRERFQNGDAFLTGDLDEEKIVAIITRESQLIRVFTEISNLLRNDETLAILVEQEMKLFQATGDALFELLEIIKTIKAGHSSLREIFKGKEQVQVKTKHQLTAIINLFRERLLALNRQVQSIIRKDVSVANAAQGNLLKAVQDSILLLFEDLDPWEGRKTKSFTFDLRKPDDDHVFQDSAPPQEIDNAVFDKKREDIEFQEIVKPRSKKQSDLFAESEELYINNSGLVLFWPYLGRFFESVGCLKKNRFVDRFNQERSVLLLQYLVKGHQEFNEYDLPLNKILCGLDANYPVPTVSRLKDNEINEADTLVTTLIQHWSALKNMSPDGFRQMFLNREGMISTRDGNYLLRVEEQAYDVLIDKMPWQITTVKLPWMENLIFVEWRL